MREILRTSDLVLVNVVEMVLQAEKIGYFVADQHMSALEGAIGAFPRRVLVDSDEWERAVRLLTEAGLGAELRGRD